MDLKYVPQALVGYFDFIESIPYAGLEQWYSISFSNAAVTVSTYPYILLKLDSNLIFANPIQCNSTTLLPFNQTGIIYEKINSNSIIIRNIQTINPSGTYQFNCRLQTKLTIAPAPITPSIDIYLAHNYTIQHSFVAIKQGVILNQAPVSYALAKPNKFVIDNPQIIN
jgi:hypothetical protein